MRIYKVPWSMGTISSIKATHTTATAASLSHGSKPTIHTGPHTGGGDDDDGDPRRRAPASPGRALVPHVRLPQTHGAAVRHQARNPQHHQPPWRRRLSLRAMCCSSSCPKQTHMLVSPHEVTGHHGNIQRGKEDDDAGWGRRSRRLVHVSPHRGFSPPRRRRRRRWPSMLICVHGLCHAVQCRSVATPS